LWYPMAVATMTFIVGSIALKETVHVKIWREVAPGTAQSKAGD
jgi:hypothetical protein